MSVDSNPANMQPEKNNRIYFIFVYFALFLICNIMIWNLFIGLVINNFKRIKDDMMGYLHLNDI